VCGRAHEAIRDEGADLVDVSLVGASSGSLPYRHHSVFQALHHILQKIFKDTMIHDGHDIEVTLPQEQELRVVRDDVAVAPGIAAPKQEPRPSTGLLNVSVKVGLEREVVAAAATLAGAAGRMIVYHKSLHRRPQGVSNPGHLRRYKFVDLLDAERWTVTRNDDVTMRETPGK